MQKHVANEFANSFQIIKQIVETGGDRLTIKGTKQKYERLAKTEPSCQYDTTAIRIIPH